MKGGEKGKQGKARERKRKRKREREGGRRKEKKRGSDARRSAGRSPKRGEPNCSGQPTPKFGGSTARVAHHVRLALWRPFGIDELTLGLSARVSPWLARHPEQHGKRYTWDRTEGYQTVWDLSIQLTAVRRLRRRRTVS